MKKEKFYEEFTDKDFKISIVLVTFIFLTLSIGTFLWDKFECACAGYVYKTETKRPIFSQCLIKNSNDKYVTLDQYVNDLINLKK